MIDVLLRHTARLLLALRYRVRVTGLEAVAERGTRGILFLPNHPALIDPFIVLATLYGRFRPRSIADQDQIDRPFIRWMAKRVGARPIPSVARHGAEARPKIQQALQECIEDLRRGENLLLYPAGRAYWQRYEDLRGNSAVHTILQALSDVRVVLIRQRGLWGSAFSRASGREPHVGQILKKGALSLLASGIVFAPRRDVSLELVEPDDFPRRGSREEINRYLEGFYNQDAPPNVYVPYTPWERGGKTRRPEPRRPSLRGSLDTVPPATRKLVIQQLQEMAGRSDVRDDHHLARDLGLDSLARVELVAWLEAEFGFAQGDAEALQTVGDVLLAACGETVSTGPGELRPIPHEWFEQTAENAPLRLPEGKTLPEVFLAQARRWPRRVVAADQVRGASTFRDLVTAVLVLKPPLERLEGERLGLMLPAGVTADTLYLAALFAEKTPVMVNWTVGRRHMTHSLDLVGVERIVTARALTARLEARGVDFGPLAERFVFLEDVAERIPFHAKLAAALRSRLSWAPLRKAQPPETAVILFTSGSETLPKAVPLTHQNLLANLRDVTSVLSLRENDRLLGFLPPFHAFGITCGVLTALCLGLRTVHHANPTQAATLAALTEAYHATVLIGTPTFLSSLARAATERQLATVRLSVTGAEKCPDRVYAALAECCPDAPVVEGYGVTECSPIISVNDEAAPIQGTIGRLLPSFDHVIVSPDGGEPVAAGEAGLLLVRGPSVFDGYLHHDGPSPFVEQDGETWYSTGDLVSEDENGVLTFRGRLKRFVKLAGEMISLPAIEAVLSRRYESDADAERSIAVVAIETEGRPETVLCTTRPLDRLEVNRTLKEAGLSPLHNIRRVAHVDAIPLLGSGKTDYRALKARL